VAAGFKGLETPIFGSPPSHHSLGGEGKRLVLRNAATQLGHVRGRHPDDGDVTINEQLREESVQTQPRQEL
jgi:hypothetical protein